MEVNKKRITLRDIKILDKSYKDNSIFFHSKHKTILRRINKKNSFFKNPEVKKLLIKNNVVNYQVSSYEGKEYLEIKPFFFPNSAANWSYAMYKDYLLYFQKLNKALQKIGLALIDCHCFNFVFYFGELKFVDLGSIKRGNKNLDKAFRRYKSVALSYHLSSAPYTRQRLDSESESPKYLDIVRDIFAKESFINRLDKLKRLFGFYKPAVWENYFGVSPENYADVPKERTLKKILKSLKPKTVYDVGCNKGHYSLIAESLGAQVVAFDPVPSCIDYLYEKIKAKKLRILPLVADIEDFLRAITRTYENLRPPKVDSVLILALIHHLVYRRGYNFEELFTKIRKMKAESLILEFVSKKDKNVSRWNQKNQKGWYNLRNFCHIGSRYFAKFKIYNKHDSQRPIVVFHGRLR